MMETPEPRDKFNERTGRRKVFELREAEMEALIDQHSCLVKDKYVEERMCPLCDAHPKNARQIWIKEGLFYNKCSCGMVYISPILKQYIVDEYYKTSRSAKEWLKVLQAQEDLDEAKFDHLLDLISKSIFTTKESKPRILDIGASYGFFLNLATSYRWNFEGAGLELSEDALKIYVERYGENSNFSIYQKKLDEWLDLSGAEGHYNVVTMWEVLEHVPDPGALLKQAKRALEPGGVLAVLVPNLWGETNRVLHERSRAFGANHLNYWNTNTLRQQLAKAGFGTGYEGTIIADVNTWWNYLNFEDPYKGGMVHPDHKKATEATLQRDAGYKLFNMSIARP